MKKIGNFDQFMRAFDRYMEKAERQKNSKQKQVATYALFQLVFATPVKTGRARGNWQKADSIHLIETGRKDTKGFTTVLEEAAKISAHRSSDKTIWLINNTPYIGLLEEGHSRTQAPEGIFAIAMPRIKNYEPEKV